MPGKPEKRTRKEARRDKEAKEAKEAADLPYSEGGLPDSVIPELNDAGAVTVGGFPWSEAELARQESAEAEIKKENEAENEFEFTDAASRAIADLEEAGIADRKAAAAEKEARELEESIEDDQALLRSLQAERREAEATEAAKAQKILDDQLEILDSIEAPKRAAVAAAAAEEERVREEAAEKKYYVDLSWRRLAAGIAVFAAFGYGCTQIVGDDGDDASNEPAVEEQDDLISIGQDGEVDSEEPAEPEVPIAPVDDVVTPAARQPGWGTTVVDAYADGVCSGMYNVFLRTMGFNNFQFNVDQLLTKNGNAFESAEGWSNNTTAMATSIRIDLSQVWFFRWNDGDLDSIYNVYGASVEFTPPESAEDLAKYEGVDSAEALASAVGASEDSCAVDLDINEVENAPFPESTS